MLAKHVRTVENTGSLEAFLAFHLLPLDKDPGLRQIGFREIVRGMQGSHSKLVEVL